GGVIVLCEQREMFAFIACEIGYPIRRRRHIRSGEPDAWRATGDRRRETVEFGAEIRISITGFPMSLRDEQIRFVAHLDTVQTLARARRKDRHLIGCS